eukprot:3172331-Pleurochrysis_carterae.AAC.1
MSSPALTATSQASSAVSPTLLSNSGNDMRETQRNRYHSGVRWSDDGRKRRERVKTEETELSTPTLKLAERSFSLSPPM